MRFHVMSCDYGTYVFNLLQCQKRLFVPQSVSLFLLDVLKLIDSDRL